jgi:phage/plasmid-like protein (TIGR03299 family)
MAHEIHIDTETGTASMMYVDEPPWHGLGTRLDRPATSAQAIQAANLDWEVIKLPLAGLAGKISHPIPDRFAVVRKDWVGRREPIFGIVGAEYTPLQNREAFEFFDSIVGRGAAVYHTAGALGHGERVWVLAKLPSEIRVVGEDISDKYLLLSNSHDGSSSVQIKFTPIRVVCQNTLTLALRQGPTLRVPHVKSLRARLERARDLLGLINTRFATIEENFQAMARRQISSEQLKRYLELVFPDPPDKQDAAAMGRVKLNRRWSEYFFEHGKGADWPGVRGTLWAAYNGVAELMDHCHPLPAGAKKAQPPRTAFPDKRRLESAWFGDAYLIKARAYREACKLLAPQA